MSERITITIEHIEADGTASHRNSASMEHPVLGPKDMWDWLPYAFRGMGCAITLSSLEKVRGE